MKFQIFKDSQGDTWWRLRADNHQIIATSGEGYRDHSHAVEMIEKIKQGCPDAEVEEVDE